MIDVFPNLLFFINLLFFAKYHYLLIIPHSSNFKKIKKNPHTYVDAHLEPIVCVDVVVLVVRQSFLPYLMLWTYFYFQTNVKTCKPSFCWPCVWDEVLYHRDKHAGWGTATGKKRYTRAACEVPISSCEVGMINPTLWIVAEGDLVCAFPDCCFPAVETKDEWTYLGYYGVSPVSITIRASWLW